LTGIVGLLFSPGNGLVIYVPLLVIAAISFTGFWKRWRPEAALILLLLLLRLAFYARWSYWDGREWGPRFLVPLLPLLMVTLIALPAWRWSRLAAVVLAGGGVAIEVLGQLVPFDTIVWPRTAPAGGFEPAPSGRQWLQVSVFAAHRPGGGQRDGLRCPLCSPCAANGPAAAGRGRPRLAIGVAGADLASLAGGGRHIFLWRAAGGLDEADRRYAHKPERPSSAA